VNYAPLYANVADMARILRSGKSIVTPVGFTFPTALDDQIVETLGSACRDGDSSLFGGGIHPGFSGDLLPLTVARLCSRIDQITVQEVADLAPHPSHTMNFEGLGFGRDPDDARENPSPLIHTMENIFRESMMSQSQNAISSCARAKSKRAPWPACVTSGSRGRMISR
jgi:2,4-diaminopentanoate dehydrogenase